MRFSHRYAKSARLSWNLRQTAAAETQSVSATFVSRGSRRFGLARSSLPRDRLFHTLVCHRRPSSVQVGGTTQWQRCNSGRPGHLGTALDRLTTRERGTILERSGGNPWRPTARANARKPRTKRLTATNEY